MQGVHLRKYGVEATVAIELFEVDGVDFRVDAVHASGDTVLTKDEAAEANTSNSFTDEGNGYSIVLTATEMQAARIVIYVIDQTATKVWLDTTIVIETYGNASAQHALDLDDAVRGGMTALPNADADAAGGIPLSTAGSLEMDTLADWINGGRLDLLLDAIPTTAMRGTDSAALASVLGTPAGASVSADIAATKADTAAILTDTADMQPKLGAPVADISTDIAAVKSDTAATLADTADMQPKLGTPAADISADIAAVKTDTDAILIDTSTTLPDIMDDLAIKKNTAFSNFEFLMVLTSDGRTPATGLTVTGQRSIDGGAFVSVGGAMAEVSNGIYQFDALAVDTNCDVITWRFSEATADDTFVTFKTVQ